MKRILAGIIGTSLFAVLFMTAGLPSRALAVDVFQPCNTTGANNAPVCKDVKAQQTSNDNPVIGAIKVVIQVLAIIIGIASVIIIIVCGLRLVSSAGDAQVITSARNGILYAIIGLVVAAVAQILVAFVLTKL